MATPAAAIALLLQVAVVVVALVGVMRLAALRALADDVRLRRLSWFFGLFAAAVAAQLLLTALLLGHGRAPAGPFLRQLNGLTLLYHGLMLAALVVAVRAFALPWRPPTPAAAAVLLVGRFGLLGLAEAGLTLYLAVASLVNQRHRRTRGSLRVAAGFLLFFLGQLAFWVFQKTGAIRPYWAEALALGGILLLVASVPRRAAPAKARRR
jgi:hypothetical protein